MAATVQQGLLFRSLPPELHFLLYSHLPTQDLARFIWTCKRARDLAEAVLYRRDAREGKLAMLWAIVLSGSGAGDRAQSGSVLKKLFHYARLGQYHVDFNAEYRKPVNAGCLQGEALASPLLIAAALGSATCTTALLDNGALPTFMGCNVSMFIPLSLRLHLKDRDALCNLRRLDRENREQGNRGISPLAYAFRRGDENIIKLLLERDHDLWLVDLDGNGRVPNIWRHSTTLHYLAATKSLGHLIGAECRRFPTFINHKIHADLAPLHLTIAYCNVTAFKALVAMDGIDIDVQTYMGRTPLLLAIQACWTAAEQIHREYFKRMSIRLIDKGADVNLLIGGVVNETPLIMAMRVVHDDWGTASEPVWAIIRHLLAHGAQLNDITPQGTTALHLLFKAFCIAEQPKDFEDKLRELIEEFGADINIPMLQPWPPYPETMLGYCLKQNPGRSHYARIKKFAQYLAEKGARLCDHELPDIFHIWIADQDMRSLKWLNMRPYGDKISEAEAFEAYKDVLIRLQDAGFARQLLGWLPWPKPANDLIPEIVFSDTVSASIRNLVMKKSRVNGGKTEGAGEDKVLRVPFDATGQNLLHRIVGRLRDDSTYTEGLAIQEAEFFISRGATTNLNPDKAHRAPKSAVSWLRALSKSRNGAFTKLLTLFRDAEEAEQGKTREDCSEYI